ncbi:hypothetical protein Bpfe_003274, partial [Biomphalaria pfeifferi]
MAIGPQRWNNKLGFLYIADGQGPHKVFLVSSGKVNIDAHVIFIPLFPAFSPPVQ